MTAPSPAPSLPPITTSHRVSAARDALLAAGLDALLVTNLVNIRWLTGFTGSAGMVALTATDLLLITDDRYGTQAPEQVEKSGSGARVEITRTEHRQNVGETFAGAERVGLEADHITWHLANEIITNWLTAADVIATNELLVGLRMIKDESELARIERAAEITDAALAAVAPRLLDGLTEVEFGLELDIEIRRRGASGTAFETIVASGPNAARPHHQPSDRRISNGDLVIIDVGALVEGYRSDMTRTFGVGDLTVTQRRIYDTVIAAQQAGVEAVAPGADAKSVDDACRSLIGDAGWGDAFAHGTGHGVGLDIHELPRIHARTTDTLAASHVVTVEPGVYLPEHGGVRIEDTVVVTAAGARRVTRTPKTLDPTALYSTGEQLDPNG